MLKLRSKPSSLSSQTTQAVLWRDSSEVRESSSDLYSTYRWIVRELITMGTPYLVAKLHKRSMSTRITMAYSSDKPAFTEMYTKYACTGIDGTAVL